MALVRITGFACDPKWGDFIEKASLTTFVNGVILLSIYYEWDSM